MYKSLGFLLVAKKVKDGDVFKSEILRERKEWSWLRRGLLVPVYARVYGRYCLDVKACLLFEFS